MDNLLDKIKKDQNIKVDLVFDETDEEILKRINSRFEILNKMAEAACQGQIRGLIISGPGGVGKSYGVRKILHENEIKNQAKSLEDFFLQDLYENEEDHTEEFDEEIIKPNHQIITAYMRPPSVYKALYNYKEEKQITVFDDCDSVMHDEVSLNILKSALDTTDERIINYGSESSALDGYERKFLYNGSTIFITNKKFDNIKENGVLSEHLLAMMTRCHYIDTTIDTDRDKILRIGQVIKEFGMLRKKGFSEKDENEVLEFIKINSENLRDLSLRMALKIANLKTIDKNNWRDMAHQTCMKRVKKMA